MAGKSDWSSGLGGCAEDAPSCVLMACCPCCNAMWVTHQYEKNPAILLFDLTSPGILNCLGLPLFAPPASLAMRLDMRKRYRIKGSMSEDIAISWCCLCCSWCQMAREIKHQKKKASDLRNMQPVNTQPGPYPSYQAEPPRTQTGHIVASY